MERYAGLTCEAIAKRFLPEGKPSERELRDLRKKALKQFWSYLKSRSYLWDKGTKEPYATDWKYGGVKITGKMGHNEWIKSRYKGQSIEIIGSAYGMEGNKILSIKIGGEERIKLTKWGPEEIVLEDVFSRREEDYPTLRQAVNAAVRELQNIIRK